MKDPMHGGVAGFHQMSPPVMLAGRWMQITDRHPVAQSRKLTPASSSVLSILILFYVLVKYTDTFLCLGEFRNTLSTLCQMLL
jgi:hypothetical protein